MKKILISTTALIVLGLMSASYYAPNDPFLWFVTTSPMFDAIRAGVFIVLVGLFFSRPPRPVYFRVILGVIAVGLGASAIYYLGTYQLQPLDAIIFLEVAVIMAIEALEYDEEVALERAARRNGRLA